MKRKYIYSIFLILITVSVVYFIFYDGNNRDIPLSDAESPSRVNSELVAEHYKAIQKVLPVEARDKLIPLDALLNGPEELVRLINSDKKLQRDALFAVLSKKNIKGTFNNYGEQILSYIAYVISDLENRNSKIAFKFLFRISRQLAIKERRGFVPGFDQKILEESVKQVPNNLPDLKSYAPLKSILLHAMSESPKAWVRSETARILASGYEESREVEEALVKQFNKESPSGAKSDIMGAIAGMAYSAKYKDGFLSPLTMDLMIKALDDSNVSNAQYAAFFVRKYKPKAALPKLMSIISDKDNKNIFSISWVLQSYGSDASEYIPQLELLLVDEIDNSRKEQLKKVIKQLSNNDTAS